MHPSSCVVFSAHLHACIHTYAHRIMGSPTVVLPRMGMLVQKYLRCQPEPMRLVSGGCSATATLAIAQIFPLPWTPSSASYINSPRGTLSCAGGQVCSVDKASLEGMAFCLS